MKNKNIKKLLFGGFSIILVISAVISCSPTSNFDPTKKDSLIQIVGPNGHKDGAFQEVAWNGLEKAKNELERFKNLKEVKATSSDQKNNMQAAHAAISAGSYVIFGNGEGFKFLSSKDFAGSNPDREFFITDAIISDNKNWKNTTAVTFASNQASFLSAVATAFYMTENASKFGGAGDLKVGFWGGAQYESVDSFIAGFVDGINYFNQKYAKSGSEITIVNSTFSSKDASYSGSWGQDTNAINMVNTLVTNGADVVFPVAGEQVKTAISKAKQENVNLMIVGVDSDPSKAYGEDAKYFITSSIKNIDKATYEFAKVIFSDHKSNFLKIHKQNHLGVAGGFVGYSEGLLKKQEISIANYKSSSITNPEKIYDYISTDSLNEAATKSHTKWDISNNKITLEK